MARDLQASLVSFLDSGPELVAPNVHVGLEGRRTLLRPIRHLPTRVVRPFQLPHLRERVGPVQIRCGGIDRGAGSLTSVDQLLQPQVHEAVHVPASAHRRHPAGEVETDEALAKLAVDARAGRVVEVLVHHHETRHDASPGKIQDGRSLRRTYGGSVPYLRDGPRSDDHRLIRARGSAGSVDDPYVRQRDDWRVNPDESSNSVAELWLCRSHCRRDRRENERQAPSSAHSRLRWAVLLKTIPAAPLSRPETRLENEVAPQDLIDTVH